MRNILTIARTDLRIFFADRGNLISLFILPVVMTLFLGGAFSGGGPAHIFVDVLDADQSPHSQQLIAELRDANPTLVICPADGAELCGLDPDTSLDLETAQARVRAEDTQAALVIPAGYGEAVAALEAVDLPYYAVANVLTGDVVRQSLETALQRVNGAAIAAQVGLGLGNALDVVADETAFSGAVFEQANRIWDNPPVSITYTMTQPSANETSGFNQSVPGMATFFVVFSVLGAGMNGLVRERKQWTLQRLVVMPVRRGEILAGKILMHVSIGILQFVIVFIVGLFVGIEFGSSPLALIIVMVIYTLAITALGLALAPRMRNESQVSALTTLLAMMMGALGGAWWPLDIAPPFMRVLGHFTPVAWAMDAFRELLFFNGTLADILLPVGVLAIFTVVLFGIGLFTFRYDT
jgi:ABC-2 type transport system permease protein